MKTNVDMKKFLETLKNRPALSRALVNPDEETLRNVISTNPGCLKYIADTAKTPTVCDYAMKVILTEIANDRSYKEYEQYAEFLPSDYLRDLPMTTKLKLVNARSSLVEVLSADYKLWLHVAPRGDRGTWEDIPEAMRTTEMLIAFVSEYPHKARHVPEEVWTEQVQVEVLSQVPTALNSLPQEVLTVAGFRAAFAANPDLSLDHHGWDLWTQDLADLATAKGHNLDDVPDRFKTYDMCLHCIKSEPNLISHVPDKHRTRELYKHVILGGILYGDWECPFGRTVDFQLEIAEAFSTLAHRWGTNILDHGDTYKKMVGAGKLVVAPTTWPKILRILPSAIQAIGKKDQTKEMVLTVIEAADSETLKQLLEHEYINRTRITKEMAPLLAGTESAAAQEMMARKLNPPRKTDRPKPAAQAAAPAEDTVLIDLSPKELEELGLN